MASVFSEDFESGSNGATVTTSNTTYSTVTGAPIFDNSTFVSGSLSAKLSPGGGSGITLKETFPSSVSHRFFRRYFKINALPSGANTLVPMRVRNGATSEAQVSILSSSGFVTLRDGNTVVDTSSQGITLNSWFRVEWEVDVTNSIQHVRLFLGSNYNGTTPDVTLNGTYSAGVNIDKIEDGIGASGYAGSMWIDAADDDDTTWPGPAAGGNLPPTANAGPDQSVSSTQTVTLDGSASSDSDGTVASYSWTQVSGTAVTLSNAGAVQPTFTAPTVTGSPSTLVFGLVVTDNLGAQSSQDTVTITVNPPATFAFSEDFDGGTNGTTIVTGMTNYSTVTGSPTYSSGAAVSGSLSAQMVCDGTTTQVFSEVFTSTVATRYFRRYFRVSALPSNVTTLMRVRNGGTTVAQVTMIASGKLQMTNITTAVATTATAITPNTWFRLEWLVDSTSNSQTLKVFVLGNYNSATPTETQSNATYTQGVFDRIVDGMGTTGSFVGTVWMDGVADNTGSYVGPAAVVNAAPTANAGPDQSVAASATVTLDGTGSADSDGAIATYVWKQTSGTTVTLSSTSAAQPTFTAPAASGTLIFSLMVIDDKGAGSNLDTITVTDSLASAAFSENFENGTNGATVTSSNTAYSSINGTVTFDNSQSVVGSLSAKTVGNGTTAGFMLQNNISGSPSERYMRRYVRLSAVPPSSTNVALIRIRNGGTTNAQVTYTNAGQLQLRDLGGTVVATSTSTYPINAWMRLEWHVDGTSTNTQVLRIYTGNLLNSPTTTSETLPHTGTASYTGGSFTRIDDGGSTATYVGSIWVDEVVDQTSTWPGPAAGANQPPVVNAGPDQTVLPGTTVTLDGTGSTDDVGIASYSWSQFSGTTVTLSSTTAAQPTFTAPTLTNGDALVFHLVVTDTGSVTSQVGVVTVNVQASNEFKLQSGSWVVMPPNEM